MLKSLYSGVSGMKGFQTKLDVIGNNIANVNTVGFKKSRVMFQDIMSQNIAQSLAPFGEKGGYNAMQIGLGSKVSSIENLHTPGSPMTTNVGTDLAIAGDGYFVVTTEVDGGDTFLTKAGNFTRNAHGFLVSSNGYFVSGVVEETPGGPAIDIPINISVDQNSNLDANGDEILDVDGNPIKPLRFTSFSIDEDGFINVVREDGKIGKLALDMSDPSSVKYYLNESPTDNQNNNISIATKVFPNPGGLNKVGNTMFEESGSSGIGSFGRIADTDGGTISAGVLEMSNVDLTEEFTEMIVAQRGFQANSRIISTADSILEEIVNLKR